jgi:hypothetical protein
MYDFNPEILKLTGKKYLEGNRQSEKYFNDIVDIIRKDFTLKEPIEDQKNIDIINQMREAESISLHVRR